LHIVSAYGFGIDLGDGGFSTLKFLLTAPCGTLIHSKNLIHSKKRKNGVMENS
jgi:hypothetical protein